MVRGRIVQIGISYGMPTKVTPHVQTGRADYFGPMVNLSARVLGVLNGRAV